jgi:hypothetical protein
VIAVAVAPWFAQWQVGFIDPRDRLAAAAAHLGGARQLVVRENEAGAV